MWGLDDWICLKSRCSSNVHQTQSKTGQKRAINAALHHKPTAATHTPISNHRLFPEGLPFAEQILISSQLVNGLKYLHSLRPSILHLDLKTANILLGGVVRVPDVVQTSLWDDLGFKVLTRVFLKEWLSPLKYLPKMNLKSGSQPQKQTSQNPEVKTEGPGGSQKMCLLC